MPGDNSSDERLKAILDHFNSTATSEEKKELERLMKARGSISGLDFAKGASPRDMAENISRQMGITSNQIKESARELVAQMVLQYDPYISDEKLKALVDHMVQGKKAAPQVPAPLLLDMISQFVDYSLGRMTAAEQSGLPEGWTAKYWEHFPESIQRLISALLKEEIPESKFRMAVVRALT
jgi:hypothetical protein